MMQIRDTPWVATMSCDTARTMDKQSVFRMFGNYRMNSANGLKTIVAESGEQTKGEKAGG